MDESGDAPIGHAARQAANGRVDVHVHDDGVSCGEQEARSGDPNRKAISDRPGHVRLATPRPRFQRNGSGAIELDRAAEQIEEWLLKWLVARLSMDPADVSRDRPFAEFGVDSLTAVELSQELEDEFDVPLPAIVAWNYPTPAALARYLAEQTTGINGPAVAVADRAIHRTAPMRRTTPTTTSSRPSWPRSRISPMKKPRSCSRTKSAAVSGRATRNGVHVRGDKPGGSLVAGTFRLAASRKVRRRILAPGANSIF